MRFLLLRHAEEGVDGGCDVCGGLGQVDPGLGGAKADVDLTFAQRDPGVPPGLSEIVMKAMTVDKARRFQSMDELRGALEHYL
jgi:hypothetical protein